MGLLDGTTHQQYYQGNDYGNYQFTSLEDIINQFLVAYVGEEKIISKVSRTDVDFHAQRAMQELSFDTFKSIKSQQIDLPPSNIMTLPHDYVNYTKVLWTDSSGIKHPIYPTKHTQNPFQIKQNDSDGSYAFPSGVETLTNEGFSNVTGDSPDDWEVLAEGNFQSNYQSGVGIIDGKLAWSYVTKNGHGNVGWGHIGIIYQQVDVSNLKYIDVSADGVVADIAYTNGGGSTGTATSTIRFGISTVDPLVINPDGNLHNHPTFIHPGNTGPPTYGSTPPGTVFPISPLASTSIFDIGYTEWTGTENSTKTIENVDVTNIDIIYVIALSFIDASEPLDNGFSLKPSNGNAPLNGTITGDGNINTLDNLSIINAYASDTLSTPIGNEKNSSTWNNYKSNTPSENQDDYQDDTYWPNTGGRYGLEPSHAQRNGSFYIDPRLGRIHFSSNISGKTVILDYISDSLGTDGEMQVHKFAEEAMYKWIMYAILSTRANTQEYIVQRYKKEKFAATRQAKLRLSNIKLEELTQILRGKSKHIKH